MARSALGDDLGKLVLRLALGVLILFHGVAKVTGGPGDIAGLVTQAGWPRFIAYGVYLGEVIAPLLVILGLWTRPAALVIALNMIAAVWLAHRRELFAFAPTGGWTLELQGMFFIAAVAVSLLGAGRYSVGGAGGRWN